MDLGKRRHRHERLLVVLVLRATVVLPQGYGVLREEPGKSQLVQFTGPTSQERT